jgi:hypothetical protein
VLCSLLTLVNGCENLACLYIMICHEFVGDAWNALFELVGGVIREYDQEAMVSVSKFVDQLPSVMNQVLHVSNLFCYRITKLLCFHIMS